MVGVFKFLKGLAERVLNRIGFKRRKIYIISRLIFGASVYDSLSGWCRLFF